MKDVSGPTLQLVSLLTLTIGLFEVGGKVVTSGGATVNVFVRMGAVVWLGIRNACWVNVPAAAAWAVSNTTSAAEEVGFLVGKPHELNNPKARQRVKIINIRFSFMVPSFF